LCYQRIQPIATWSSHLITVGQSNVAVDKDFNKDGGGWGKYSLSLNRPAPILLADAASTDWHKHAANAEVYNITTNPLVVTHVGTKLWFFN
jgi:hypothetical protein